MANGWAPFQNQGIKAPFCQEMGGVTTNRATANNDHIIHYVSPPACLRMGFEYQNPSKKASKKGVELLSFGGVFVWI
jgi:hypothetical protein